MTYCVEYKIHSAGEVKSVCVTAKNKADAYDVAAYEIIPAEEGQIPYAAWVVSVTYANGKSKTFYTHEGKPY